MLKAYPLLKQREIQRELHETWNNMDTEQRKPFKVRERKLRQEAERQQQTELLVEGQHREFLAMIERERLALQEHKMALEFAKRECRILPAEVAHEELLIYQKELNIEELERRFAMLQHSAAMDAAINDHAGTSRPRSSSQLSDSMDGQHPLSARHLRAAVEDEYDNLTQNQLLAHMATLQAQQQFQQPTLFQQFAGHGLPSLQAQQLGLDQHLLQPDQLMLLRMQAMDDLMQRNQAGSLGASLGAQTESNDYQLFQSALLQQQQQQLLNDRLANEERASLSRAMGFQHPALWQGMGSDVEAQQRARLQLLLQAEEEERLQQQASQMRLRLHGSSAQSSAKARSHSSEPKPSSKRSGEAVKKVRKAKEATLRRLPRTSPVAFDKPVQNAPVPVKQEAASVPSSPQNADKIKPPKLGATLSEKPPAKSTAAPTSNNGKSGGSESDQPKAGPEDSAGPMQFLQKVRDTFQHRPEVYSSFLKLMGDFKHSKITADRVVERVVVMFADHPDLLKGFEEFL